MSFSLSIRKCQINYNRTI